MALDNKRQTLQHLRSDVEGAQVSASTILEGEIAVRYTHKDPALMIKDTDNHIVEFIASGAIHTAIENNVKAIEQEIEGLETRIATDESAITANSEKIDDLSGNLETLSSVTADFSAATYNEFNTLSGNVHETIKSFSSNTMTEIKTEAQTRLTADQTITASLSAVSASVITINDTFATKAELSAASANIETTIITLSGDVYNDVRTVSGDIESTINTLSSNTINAIKKEAQDRNTADTTIATSLSAVSAEVITIKNTYATKAELSAASADIQTTIITLSGDVYTDIRTVSGDIESTISTLSSNTMNEIKTEAQTRSTADNAIRTDLSGVSGSLVTYIDSKAKEIQDELGTVYHIKGSVADYTALPADAKEGDVYNVVASGVTTSTAIEGSGKTFEAGSNFVWVTKNDASGYTTSGWDIMGGTVDFTALNALSSSVISEINTRKQEVNRLDGRIDAISGAVSSLTENYATKAELSGVSGNIETTIIRLSGNVYTDVRTVSGNIESTINTLSSNTMNEIKTEAQTRENADKTISASLSAVSAAVVTINDTFATKAELSGVSGNIETTIITLSGDVYNDIRTVSGNVASTISTLSSNTMNEIKAEAQAREAADTAITASLSAVSGVAVTAVQNVLLDTVSDYTKADTMVNANNTATGAYVEKDGTTVKLDLTYLSIDCGTF